MIRLAIADDHAIVRQGLKQLFAMALDIKMVGEVEDGKQLLDFLKHNDIDLILLDLTMPGCNGLELIAQIRARHLSLKIVVLSMHNELQLISLALQAGANCYLTKDSDPDIILSAIRKVIANGHFIEHKLAEKLIFPPKFYSSKPKQPHELLSEREFQVFKLLVNGKSVNEISQEISISSKTVSTHKARLFEKLKIKNITELVRYHDAVKE